MPGVREKQRERERGKERVYIYPHLYTVQRSLGFILFKGVWSEDFSLENTKIAIERCLLLSFHTYSSPFVLCA